ALVGRRPQLTVEERFGHLERTAKHPLASHIWVMQRRLDGESVDERAEQQSHLVGIGVTELTRPLPGSDHGSDLLAPPVVQSLTSLSRCGITKSAGPKLDPEGPVVLIGRSLDHEPQLVARAAQAVNVLAHLDVEALLVDRQRLGEQLVLRLE